MVIERSVLFRLLVGLLFMVGAIPATAAADPVQAPYQWREVFFDAPDGTRLHADVLRPRGISEDTKTPVIMTVSPYRSHMMYLIHTRPQRSPSVDNLNVEMFLNAGYTYVVADLRGFGGSAGCPDFGGPGERMDVQAAVEWAADQPWSTGKVGLAGTSYEGWTGMMGLAQRPRGLAAVLAAGAVVDPNAYLYQQGIAWRFSARPLTDNGLRPGEMAGFEHLLIASTPPRPDDSPEYQADAIGRPRDCYARYVQNVADHNPDSEFWRARRLPDVLRGNTIPTFLVQGFVDANTRPDRQFEVWDALGPGDHRAWFGPWGHRDCHDNCGTPQYDQEVLAFFDRHVAGKEVTVPGPRVTVGAFDGTWRSETAWPPADSRRVPIALRTGTYTDRGPIPGPERDIWSISEPLAQPQHLSGLPSVTATATGPAEASLAAEIYDIDPGGRATVITRGIAPIGAGEPRIRMLATDWPIPAGHRIGVRLADIVDDVWARMPTGLRITVTAATAELPLLAATRVPDLPGGVGEGLVKWRDEKTIALDPALVNNATMPMTLPERDR
ncbi:CocE/NonD family hydrolase [Nocardia panacis]|uniref:CocE/NonD family hydrolase n=1 Tax=Nocardia panacis TaxID=2340916 RepID=A0A3A4KIS6_9NOCA|nr:CocE/NonD family hydrolase [Nocardia panacis]RJO69053.1 CocE/NonD family hydrolase [Nocardia panacis]